MKKLLCILSCVCLLAVLCACTPGAPALHEDALFVDGAYVRVCYLDDGQKKPVILVGHGLGGDSSQMLSTGRTLAGAGFFVLLPDAPSHGQTKDTSPDCLIAVIQASSLQYDRLLSTFEDDPNADTSRVGATGFSMGAMTAFYYAATPSQPSPPAAAHPTSPSLPARVWPTCTAPRQAALSRAPMRMQPASERLTRCCRTPPPWTGC